MMCFGGSKWNNIPLEEKIHFFGMVLKMSIEDGIVGGYTEYVYDEIFTDLAEDYSVNVKGSMSKDSHHGQKTL